MRQFGLIGYPLTHSFSKQYFTAKFEKENIHDCEYHLYPLQTIDEFPELLKKHTNLNGLNVTIPYKEKVLPFLSHQSEVVKATGACNCIVIENGLLTGHNTDVVGFQISLKKKLKPSHNKALVLGTGGAAKAVQWVLQEVGINYYGVSRQPQNQQLSYEQVTEELLKEHLLIINTTPLGMHPHTQECPSIPYEFLSAKHYLYDLIYNPAETEFLKKGRAQGALTENGMDMLVLQAEENWKIWNPTF